MRQVVLQDANILIDCTEIGLLEYVFQLPFQCKTTDLVWNELKRPDRRAAIQPFVEKGLLCITTFSAEQFEEIAVLMTRHPGLSLADCSAWYGAEANKAILLTGDGLLRKTASNHGIEVHGTLWLFDELVKNGALDSNAACLMLQQLSTLNRWLPEKEMQIRIKMWCKHARSGPFQ